jgi:hypothetical protein
MTVGKTTGFAVVAAALGILIAPAFAQNGASDMQSSHAHNMSMDSMGQSRKTLDNTDH